MKALDLEKMETLEGGSCAGATFGLVGSWLGLFGAALSGPAAPIFGAAAICGIVAASAYYEEAC